MSTQQVSQPDKFRKTFSELFDVMVIIISDLNTAGKTTLNVNNVNLVKEFMMALDKNYLITTFINNSNEYWDNILNKNDEFFVNNSQKVFGSYSDMPEFNALKVIFHKNKDGVSLVDEDTKDAVRDYLYALIKISIVHVFNSREPKVEKNGSKVTISYGKKSEYANIDIMGHAKKWEIKLWS